jgi:GT2 family glycosyltransferase
VSLLLPNRNNELVLDLVLERLARNTTYPDVEVVAVDDGSTDRSREILRRWRDSGRFANFNLIECEHRGVVDTLNEGLSAATGEIVVQLDADASVETEGWIERMLALFLSDERIGVVVAKVVIDTGLVHALGVNLVGESGLHDRGTRPAEPPGRRTLHSRVTRPTEGESELEPRVAEVDSGIGCCMMYRRAVALAVGGYDRGFSPVWFDDLDLCLSIRKAGRKVFYLPDVRVIHHLSMRPAPPRGSALMRLRARAGKVLPVRLAETIGRRLKLDRPPPEQQARLDHHYAYWREKWGWDLINPDVDAILARYGDTELGWAYDAKMTAAGREIAARFEGAAR